MRFSLILKTTKFNLGPICSVEQIQIESWRNKIVILLYKNDNIIMQTDDIFML